MPEPSADPDVNHLDELSANTGKILGNLTEDLIAPEARNAWQRDHKTYLFANHFYCHENFSSQSHTKKTFMKRQLFGNTPWLEYEALVAATSSDARQMIAHLRKTLEAALGHSFDVPDAGNHGLTGQDVASTEYRSGKTKRMAVVLRHRFIVERLTACDIPAESVWEIVRELDITAGTLTVINSPPPGVIRVPRTQPG
jgi:hypothetical protein